jgi:hypothetical protein
MSSEPDTTRAPTDAQDQELVFYLERDQLVEETARPLRRAKLSRPAQALLWALRVAVIVFGAMVAYTFVWQLGH